MGARGRCSRTVATVRGAVCRPTGSPRADCREYAYPVRCRTAKLFVSITFDSFGARSTARTPKQTDVRFTPKNQATLDAGKSLDVGIGSRGPIFCRQPASVCLVRQSRMCDFSRAFVETAPLFGPGESAIDSGWCVHKAETWGYSFLASSTGKRPIWRSEIAVARARTPLPRESSLIRRSGITPSTLRPLNESRGTKTLRLLE